MFKNHLLIALRNFWKHKFFSFINILGLSIGISAALVIYLMVAYDLGFDKFHKDSDRVYRIVTDMKFPGQDFKNSGVPAPMPEAVRKEVTGLETVTAFHVYDAAVKVTIPAGNGKEQIYKRERDIVFADDSYFKLLPYKWLAGSSSVMKEPFKVVLTKSRAEKYFGKVSEPAKLIGLPVYFNDTIKTAVAGIVEDLPHRSDFTFKEFVSLATAQEKHLREDFGFEEWGSINSSSQLFVKLAAGTTPQQVEKQLVQLRKKYTQDDKNANTTTTHRLQPLADLHFNPDYDNFDQRQASLATLYGLMLVAAFLLVLGCINFINLTTAQASQRAKEIGVRKTMGSTKKQLVMQFLTETTLLTLAATLLSVLITPWIMNIFSDFIPDGLSFSLFNGWKTMLFLVLLVLLVSVLSGFYPALVLSRFKPVTVLKNQAFANTAKTRGAWVRKTLTVSQFVIAQVFIMATIVVSKQISYSLNKQLGYKKEAIVFLNSPWQEPKEKRAVFAQKLRAIPGIQMVSLAGSPPASRSTSSQTMTFIDGEKKTETTVEIKSADTNYFKIYNMKLLAGRWLRASDTVAEYIINETYAKFLGFRDPREAVGRFISRGTFNAPVVGVMADFHTKSLHVPIKPLAYSTQQSGVFHIALDPGAGGAAWQKTLKTVENEWKSIYPEHEFEYTFFDESIEAFYKSERNMARLLAWATGLAILISCLGLLGLVIYTTNLRVKEIGIRKVLGASVGQLVSLLSKDFMRLVALAFIVAAPITWWGMYKWLQDFAYRTDISWWIFALGGSIMMLIALFTLSIQTIRSARANPVKNLRTE
jgi:putative ABC transport system permease protein